MRSSTLLIAALLAGCGGSSDPWRQLSMAANFRRSSCRPPLPPPPRPSLAYLLDFSSPPDSLHIDVSSPGLVQLDTDIAVDLMALPGDEFASGTDAAGALYLQWSSTATQHRLTAAAVRFDGFPANDGDNMTVNLSLTFDNGTYQGATTAPIFNYATDCCISSGTAGTGGAGGQGGCMGADGWGGGGGSC